MDGGPGAVSLDSSEEMTADSSFFLCLCKFIFPSSLFFRLNSFIISKTQTSESKLIARYNQNQNPCVLKIPHQQISAVQTPR